MVARDGYRLFTIDEYDRLGETGIVGEDEHVELIEGELRQMSPIGARHAASVSTLGQTLTILIGFRAEVRVQNPVRLPPDSEPEPDIVLARRRADHYRRQHPNPEDVLLLVEVADRSLGFDQTVKLPIYARAGITEVWIADIENERVTVYQEPSVEGYRQIRPYQRGESFSPAAFADVAISVDQIFG